MALFNSYQITLNNPSSAAMKRWRIDGSNDETKWTVVDSREGLFYFDNRSTALFDCPSLSQSYRFYRFYFLEATTAVYAIDIAEFELLLKPSVVPTTVTFHYPFNTYFFFPGQTGIVIEPVIDGYLEAAPSSSLCEGLVFSQHSGVISGAIPETAELGTFSYLVVGTHRNGVTTTTQLQLNIVACMISHHRVTFTLTSIGQGSQGSWSIRQNGEEIVGGRGIDTDTAITSVENLCIQEGEYELHLHSLTHGWPSGMNLHVSLLLETDVIDYGTITLSPPNNSKVIPLSFELFSDGSVNGWFYYPDLSIPSDWTSETPSSSWSTLSTTLFRSGSVWLFRKTYSLQSIQSIQQVDYRIFGSPGFIMYINNQRVIAMNVPAGPLTSSTTCTTIGGSYWHLHSFSVSDSHLRSGSNVIAIAIVHPSDTTRVVDFKSIIILRSETAVMSMLNVLNDTTNSVSVTANMHLTGHDVLSLFDSNTLTYYSASWSSNRPAFTLSFISARQDLYNRYCFISSPTSPYQNDPFAWVIESSANGDEWSSIQEVDSVRFQRGERRCAFFPTISSQFFRVRFTNTAGLNPQSMDLAEFSLLFTKDTQSVGITLDYSVTSFTAFRNVDFNPSYSLNNHDFTHFTITPVLPNGLYLDSISGLLFGIPVVLSNPSTYTITAEAFEGITSSVVITVQVVDCDGFENSYSLLTVGVNDFYSSAAPFNTIHMILHNTEETIVNEVIVSESSTSRDTSFLKRYCLPSGSFSLQFLYLIQTTVIPRYSIIISTDQVISEGEFDTSSTYREFQLSTERLIHPTSTSWYYLVNGTHVRSDWYKSVTTFSWLQALPSYMETPSSLTSYYCTTFHASYIPTVSGYLIGARVRGGFILYLNGIEINRVNLPAGDITSETPPTDETEESSYVVYGGSIQFDPFSVSSSQIDGAPEGHNNRVCIEVHQSVSPSPNDFSAYLEFIQDQSDRIIDGEPWGNVNSVGDPWNEVISNAFDKNPSTKYYGSSQCQDVIVQWTYHNHRREFANKFRFYAGNSHIRRPKTLAIVGSNDGETWNPLFEARSLEWDGTSAYGQTKEWSFNNTHSYNAYRVIANGCINEGIEFAEVYLFSTRVDVSCEATGSFPAASEGQESHGPCPSFHIGYSVRVCQNGVFSEIDYSQCVPTPPTPFTYSPSSVTVYTHSFLALIPDITFFVNTFYVKPGLPVGVNMNFTTGVISGTPYEEATDTEFTITAVNSRGKATSTVHIMVRSGCPSIGDFPSTPVGEEASYRCTQNMWMYGTVKRRCEENDGIPVWSEPQGYCKNTVVLLIMVLLFCVILFAILITWCISESMNRRMNVYQLPNGEIEMEEIDASEEAVQQQSTRPRKKLIGRPVFIYIPRYFPKAKKNPGRSYHEMKKPTGRVLRIQSFSK